MRIHTALTAALLAAAVTATTAGSDLDEMLVVGDRLETRLVAGERRNVAIGCVPGQKLSVTVRRGKGSSVEPYLYVMRPDGQDLDPGKRLKVSKRSARVRGLRVDTEGRWRIGFSALSGGGDVSVTVQGDPPSRVRLEGATTTAETPVERSFFALPGSLVAVRVASRGKPAWEPLVEIVTPSGARVALPPGKRQPATVVLDELGEHRLAVAGGPGEFTAKLAIRPPRVKGRTLQFADVEARPVITSYGPTTIRNDDEAVVIDIQGFGFASSQSLTIRSPDWTWATAKLSVVPGGARAVVDTTGVFQGQYDVGVRTSSGNTVLAEERVTVTNRPPSVRSVTPGDIAEGVFADLLVSGAGFDYDCEVELRRASDDAPMLVGVWEQPGPGAMTLLVAPLPYRVGVYDMIVTDPLGTSQAFPAQVDVLGYRARPKDVFVHDAPGFTPFSTGPADAAYDAERGRVLVAVEHERQVEFVLFDAVSLETLDVLTVAATSQQHVIVKPRVAWNPVDDTFAMTWCRQEGSVDRGFARVCSAADLDDELGFAEVVAGSEIDLVDVAAQTDRGGFLVVADAYDGSGSTLYSLAVPSSGVVDAGDRIAVHESPFGLIWEPRVVVFIGVNAGFTDWALRRLVLRNDGSIGQGDLQIAASGDWLLLDQPLLAADTETGAVLCGFTYIDADSFLPRPAFALLSPESSKADVIESQSADGLLPLGAAAEVAWNPEREEFVYVTVLGGVLEIRRVARDGTLRARGVPPEYEGLRAVVWSGPEPGQLGFVRSCDGDDSDLYTDLDADSVHIRAGRIR